VAPVFTVFMGIEGARMTPFIGLVVAVVVGMAFYFGGMLASYRAPFWRRLHGVAVAVTSFAVSLAVNLGTLLFFETDQDPLANLRTGGEILFTAALFAVSVAAAYLGARRGEEVYTHNLVVARKRERREQAKSRREAARQEASEGTDTEGK
jgi:multisubunit Na+/H+ antiporter MnhG subunit